MNDKNGAVLNVGDIVVVRFTVYSVDQPQLILLQTEDQADFSQTPTPGIGPHIPFRCLPEFTIKSS